MLTCCRRQSQTPAPRLLTRTFDMGCNGEPLADGRIWSGPLKLLLPVLYCPASLLLFTSTIPPHMFPPPAIVCILLCVSGSSSPAALPGSSAHPLRPAARSAQRTVERGRRRGAVACLVSGGRLIWPGRAINLPTTTVGLPQLHKRRQDPIPAVITARLTRTSSRDPAGTQQGPSRGQQGPSRDQQGPSRDQWGSSGDPAGPAGAQ